MFATRLLRALLLALTLGTLVSACAKETPAMPAKPALNDPRLDSIVLGMGCFWGAEKRMSELPGVVDVESGYANGEGTGSYQAILAHEDALQAGLTQKRNYAEVVKVTFDPAKTTLEQVLIKFWESHDPTQGDRQGNDVGSNYRSAIYTHGPAQLEVAQHTRAVYQQALTKAGRGTITTDIAPLQTYHRAEEYHQDYLKKHPKGYCGLGGTGVKYPGASPGSGNPAPAQSQAPQLDGKALNFERQLVVFEAEDCAYCKQFKAEVLAHWQALLHQWECVAVCAGWHQAKPLPFQRRARLGAMLAKPSRPAPTQAQPRAA
jgi:peptide methionine sulfoxide reductase msrA/msrB